MVIVDSWTIKGCLVEQPTQLLSTSLSSANKIIIVLLGCCWSYNHWQGRRWRQRWLTPHHQQLIGGRQSLPSFSLMPLLTTQHPPLLPIKCHHCCLLHVIVTAMRAEKCWVRVVQHHHCKAGPTLSQLDGVLYLPSLSVVKLANQKSNWDCRNAYLTDQCNDWKMVDWYSFANEYACLHKG